LIEVPACASCDSRSPPHSMMHDCSSHADEYDYANRAP
jgi:hypothetical protein